MTTGSFRAPGRRRRRCLVLAERLREQAAGVGPPGEVGIGAERLGPVDALEPHQQRLSASRIVQVAGELDHGRVVQRRVAVEVAPGGEDQQRAADGGISFRFLECDSVSRYVGENDELNGAVSRSGTRLRSSRA